MVLLAFEKVWRLPYDLATLPEGGWSIRWTGCGAVLLYPYCGAANQARRIGWRWPAPALFLLAENDSIDPAKDCLDVVDLPRSQGADVEAEVFSAATHGFDQELRKPFSTMVFDPGVTAEAMELAEEFLDRLGH